MNDMLSACWALAAGVLLGAIFFGGLWWTVKRGLASPYPVLWFFPSLLLRMSIAMAGFYLIGREHWEHWLLCALGFALARLGVRWLTGAATKAAGPCLAEARHAP